LTTQHEFLDTAIQKVGNRYIATMLIAKRTRQLYHGAPTRVPRQEGESNFSVAVREIAEGLVVLAAPSDTSTASTNGTANEASAAVEDTNRE
jgi:DNA-directed RNA polymerase omega subunit